MKPRSILDPAFRYTNASNTDIRKTFARIRREQARERQAQEQLAQVARPIISIKRRETA